MIVVRNFADSQEPQKIFSPQQFILDQNTNNNHHQNHNHNHNDNNEHQNNANNNRNNHHGIDDDDDDDDEKEINEDAIKPAISFQQQQFQNGGTLTVTNSHVTVKFSFYIFP